MDRFLFSVRFKVVISYIFLVFFVLQLSFVHIHRTAEKVLVSELKANVSRSGEAFMRRVKPLLSSELKVVNPITEEILDRNVDSTKMRYIIISEDSRVQFDSYKEYTGRDFSWVPEVNSALEGKRVSHYIHTSCNAEEIYYASPIFEDAKLKGCLFISASTVGVKKQLRNFTRSTQFIFVYVLAFTFIVAYFYSGSISDPITELARNIKLSEKNISFNQLPIYDDDELSVIRKHHNTFVSQGAVAEDQVNRFLSNVSHELKTPIASMKVLSETLLDTPSDDIELYRDFFNDINTEMDHLDSIIDNLISLVYMQGKDYVLETELVDVTLVTRNRVTNMGHLAEKKHIELSFEGETSIETRVDKTKYIQVVDNLINNAIKYTQEGGKIEVKIYKRDMDFVLEVSDNGIGISEMDQFLVFNRFYMVDNSRQRSKGSSGLGLSIVRQIVTLHSGNIEIRSELGKGSVFEVSIPLML